MEDLFISVLNMSLTSSYVIAAIMPARLFLKRAPKVISYALWAVAGFRLVFPFSFESVFSLIPFKSSPIPADIAMQPLPRVDSGISIVDNAVSRVIPAATPAVSVNPLQVWLAVGACLWLAGIAVMLTYSVVSIVLLKRRLCGAMFVGDNIFEADNLKTPFVLGLFKPKIYIPTDLKEEEKRYIILHERTHIRRYDHVVKLFAYFILCLHWFNPFAWAAFLLMSTDMEMSCDESVLKEIGRETKKAYSLSLLYLAAERRIIGGSPLAFGEGGMKERIKNVLNFKKPSRVTITVAVTLVAVLSAGFALNKANDGTVDVDLQYFEANGFRLGGIVSGEYVLTPKEPIDGYDYNYEEVRYSTDPYNGVIRKMHVNVFENGLKNVYDSGGPEEVRNWYTIEQVIEFFGLGKSGWQDREQRLRYMEYRQKEGRLSATVRFVYTDGESDGINHRLVWVIAESSLPYPYPVEIKQMTLDNIRELAQKGDSLTFEDFKDFKGGDYSSSFDYHIMLYGVEGGYRLIVRTDGKHIDSANLESIWESGGSGIDIRYDDIGEFIENHPSSGALTSDEARAVAEDNYPTASEVLEAGEETITQPTFTLACYVFEIVLPGGETQRIAVAKRNGIVFRYSDGRWLVPIGLSAYTESTAMGWDDIEKGTQRDVVIEIMGEPDFMLSGFYGDGYVLEDGSEVIFYYGADESVYEIKRSDGPWELLGNADVDKDGLKESIYLDQSQRDDGFVTLRIYDGSGNAIWSEPAGTSHTGWTSLFLCEQDGEYYLLRYLPSMWQGYCTYTYTLFTPEGGVEHVVRSNAIDFDINGVNKLDAPKIVAFAEEVNELLGKSTLLLSSEGGEYFFGPSSAEQFFEKYSWLDETPELYEDGDDLQTRLVKYSEYAVSNHR